MGDPIEGKWRLEMGRPPADPAGNDFLLSGGQVALAGTGEAFGSYELEPGRMTMTLPMPPVDGELAWDMIVSLLVPEPLEPADLLPGIMVAVVSRDRQPIDNTRGTCVLVRLRDDTAWHKQ